MRKTSHTRQRRSFWLYSHHPDHAQIRPALQRSRCCLGLASAFSPLVRQQAHGWLFTTLQPSRAGEKGMGGALVLGVSASSLRPLSFCPVRCAPRGVELVQG